LCLLFLGEYENDFDIKINNTGEYYMLNVGVLDVGQYFQDIEDKLVAVDVKQTGSNMELNVTSDKEQYLLIPLFNDDGFTYRVNGNKVEALRFLDTLMMIPVTKGDNVVELSYCSPGLLIGGIASIIGLLLLGLYLKFNTVITKNSWLQTISVFCTYTAGIVLFIAIIVLPVIYMFII
ncbi:MAG: YfhO family protein, partial [Erysipelotrichaceae bacterium]|nr:YfhO family protein [Erysipelotrichaceae bacterium]